MNMDHEQAYNLLKQHMKDQANLNHSRESEVIMCALAKKLGEDQDYWGNLGLLHDIDWEYGEDVHCKKCREILSQAGFDDEFIETVISHGYGFEACGPELAAKKRTTKIQYLLAAAETITGLIYASALVRPDKKLESVEVSSIKKKMKDKSFAAKVNREVIKECELAGIPLDEFIDLSLIAVKEIASGIGI
jgi:putative nucleotidyltransferase with HDIG domain